MADLRMPDLNKVFLAGRLTADPELRYISTGSAVCTLRLAVSRVYKTRDGEKKEDALFINVDTWDKTAEFCANNLRKGRPVLVEGVLKSDSWEDKATGQKRTRIDVRAVRVQKLDWDDRTGPGPTPAPEATPESKPSEEPIPEDDIPF